MISRVNLKRRILLLCVFGYLFGLHPLWALPLKINILDDKEQPVAKGLVYIDYVEILDLSSKPLGKIGIVNLNGNLELFLIKEEAQNRLVGRAKNKKLYDGNDRLIGYYDWSTFWVYAYSDKGKKLGKAKCIAFRGICAAGVAAYLTELLTKPIEDTPELSQPPKQNFMDGGTTLN